MTNKKIYFKRPCVNCGEITNWKRREMTKEERILHDERGTIISCQNSECWMNVLVRDGNRLTTGEQ